MTVPWGCSLSSVPAVRSPGPMHVPLWVPPVSSTVKDPVHSHTSRLQPVTFTTLTLEGDSRRLVRGGHTDFAVFP